jgi:hypothetical protein
MANLRDLEQYFDGFLDYFEHSDFSQEMKYAWQLIAQFGEFVHAYARSNPHILHHVYEWGMVGIPEGRLFELSAVPYGSGVAITYEFLESHVPNENGVVFSQKAEVMESGQQVSFETDKPVPIGDSFRVGQFTFIPGGTSTNGAFRELFVNYFITKTQIVVGGGGRMHPTQMTRVGGESDARRIYDSLIR